MVDEGSSLEKEEERKRFAIALPWKKKKKNNKVIAHQSKK